MVPACFRSTFRRLAVPGLAGPALAALALLIGCHFAALGDPVSTRPKHTIGATATLTEVSTGLPFQARIDTGARSCSLHVEKMEIKDESEQRSDNIGKAIRFLIKNRDGNSAWIETTIAGAVRVRSSAANGHYDHRYKVRLTLKWKDFRKEVLVTLNDRANMDYPLLIGRNFLYGDFLVDVSLRNPD